jgi:tetratricopeptide (TPR) repeat protein
MKTTDLLLVVLFCLTGCRENQPSFQAPVLKNIGNYSVGVTTKSPHAQMFFNQGIIMANNFNHDEAHRSFREAIRLDSAFAMGYWGIAYVLGPNFNSTANMGTIDEIRTAVAHAVALSNNATDWEKALINAIQVKFPKDTVSANAEGFSNAMRQAFIQFPDNSFVATLYAESVMNLHPWDFFSRQDGTPRPWTPELVSLLEKVIAIDPNNPLANHLYLHATEAGRDLSKALISAQRLETLVPSAGHLVHMPSHIYINTGDYHKGSISNENAVAADSLYIADCKAQGYYPQLYYPHNYHFLAATATFEGRGARAIEAAYKTADLIDKKYYYEPGYETVQHYLTIPYHVLLKFGQWEKILILPRPATNLVYPTAMWHYAKGIALSNLGKPAQAQQELDSLNALTQSPAIAQQYIWGINKVTDVCTLASRVLTADLAVKGGNPKEAIQLLREAVILEDNFNYNEPPDWFFSVRHMLGNVLLGTGNYTEAEKVYREDLITWPQNGYALNGLSESLLAQGKASEAQQTKEQFDQAWNLADSPLKGSIVDPSRRKDLTLRIDRNAPNTLVYLAGTFCMRK